MSQSWDLNSVLSAFKVTVINDYTAFKLDKQGKNNTFHNVVSD